MPWDPPNTTRGHSYAAQNGKEGVSDEEVGIQPNPNPALDRNMGQHMATEHLCVWLHMDYVQVQVHVVGRAVLHSQAHALGPTSMMSGRMGQGDEQRLVRRRAEAGTLASHDCPRHVLTEIHSPGTRRNTPVTQGRAEEAVQSPQNVHTGALLPPGKHPTRKLVATPYTTRVVLCCVVLCCVVLCCVVLCCVVLCCVVLCCVVLCCVVLRCVVIPAPVP